MRGHQNNVLISDKLIDLLSLIHENYVKQFKVITRQKCKKLFYPIPIYVAQRIFIIITKGNFATTSLL